MKCRLEATSSWYCGCGCIPPGLSKHQTRAGTSAGVGVDNVLLLVEAH